MPNTLGPFRIVLLFPGNPQKHFYWRDGERIVNGRSTIEAQFSPDPHDARYKHFRTTTEAIARRDSFRQRYGQRYQVFVESVSGLGPLFEDRGEQTQSAGELERVDHYVEVNGVDILILPASCGRWAIRFPKSNFETLYGSSPDAVADLYRQQVALRPELAQFVEMQPDMSTEELARQIEEVKSAIAYERTGRISVRPGSVPR